MLKIEKVKSPLRHPEATVHCVSDLQKFSVVITILKICLWKRRASSSPFLDTVILICLLRNLPHLTLWQRNHRLFKSQNNLQTWKCSIFKFILTKRTYVLSAMFSFLEQERANFFHKGQIVNILGYTGHKVSVATAQLWLCGSKQHKHGCSSYCNGLRFLFWHVMGLYHDFLSISHMWERKKVRMNINKWSQSGLESWSTHQNNLMDLGLNEV